MNSKKPFNRNAERALILRNTNNTFRFGAVLRNTTGISPRETNIHRFHLSYLYQIYQAAGKKNLEDSKKTAIFSCSPQQFAQNLVLRRAFFGILGYEQATKCSRGDKAGPPCCITAGLGARIAPPQNPILRSGKELYQFFFQKTQHILLKRSWV